MEHPHTKPPFSFMLMMAMLMALVALSVDTILPGFGEIGHAFGLQDTQQTQWLISSLFAGMVIGQILSGPLADSWGRKPVLYGFLVLFIAASFLCLYAPTFEMLVLGRFIQGIAVAGPRICSISIIRDQYKGRHMASVMSVIMMIFIMLPIFAPAIGQAVMHVFSWQMIFKIFIAYGMILMVWMHFKLQETLAPENRTPFKAGIIWQHFKTVVTNRQTLLSTLAMGFVFGMMIGYLNSTWGIYQEIFQKGEMFVVYFGVQATGLAIASLLNARFVERYGMRFISRSAAMAIVVLSICMTLYNLYVPNNFPVFFAFCFACMFCCGLMFGNLNALAIEPMGKQAGMAAAIISSVSNVIAIASGTVISMLFNHTLFPLVIGYGVLCCISAILITFTKPEAV